MAQAPRHGDGALEITPALRAQLGLAATESLRLLDAGARTILLERCGSASMVALPWDRELVLSANVRAFPLAEILGLIHGDGKSGFLLFTSGEHQKSVYLHRGEVVFATSNQRVDRLGECLLRAGVIGLEQLRETERRFTPPDRFGKVLVERGFLTPRELWHGVKYQVEEIVRSLFAYASGSVHVWEGEVQPDNVVRLSLPTRRLVAEGLQRRDELLKFVTLLENPRVELLPVPGAGAHLAGSERAIYEAMESERAFGAILRKVGLDPLSAARTVQLLRVVGAVKLVRLPPSDEYVGEGDLRLHDEDLLRARVEGGVKLLAELAAPIVAVEGGDALARRFERTVEEAAQRHPEMLGGIRVGRAATLDPEDLLRRALQLKGDREAELGAALGELVAYLEFELKNHPAIPEPDRFLTGLEELRAKLAV